jgi:hypothetical protein
MLDPSNAAKMAIRPHTHLIEVRIRELQQLFNSMDPTPFHHQDLDPDAEEFIVSWALEHPAEGDIGLVIHLEKAPAESGAEQMAAEAIHNYFAYRVELIGRELRQLMQRGRTSLIIGLAFLGACLLIADAISHTSASALASIVKESLTIGGWVARWRPLEIFLYDWWPLTARRRVLRKLSLAPVKLKLPRPCV